VFAAPDEDDDDDEEEAVAAPEFPALVAIVRALDEICEDEREEDVVPVDWDPADALNVDCARMAARKFARNGLFVDMVDMI